MKYTILMLSTFLLIGCGKDSNIVGISDEGVITTLTINTLVGGCYYSLDVYIDDVPVMSIQHPNSGTVDISVGEHELRVEKEVVCASGFQSQNTFDVIITVTESGFTDTY